MASKTKFSGKLAVITGASTGIGYYLADECAEHGFDVIVAADEAKIEDAAEGFRARGVDAVPVQADLSTTEGVEELYKSIGGREVDVLIANAGRGLGKGFLDQNFEEIERVIDTNITGTLYLVQKVARDMRARGEGHILITGSIAGFTPGAYQAVYNGTKSFINSFSFALRAELEESGVVVTCLMPGATETEFFATAGLLDTKIGASEKDSPEKVARDGFKAMLRGDGDIVSGWHNKLQTVIANVTPASVLAEAHKKKAAPGSARG
jgi:short-subunit dehydrogenase